MELITQTVNEQIERVEAELLKSETFDPVECPLRHAFTPGIYVRTITMPAGAYIIGHEHRTEHPNIVHRGKALVSMNGEGRLVEGPCMFTSGPGVRKCLIILEEMEWSTVHANPDDERDIEKLEDRYIIKSASHQQHFKELKELEKQLPP